MQLQHQETNNGINPQAHTSIHLETPMKAFKKLHLIFILIGGIALAFGGPVGILFGIVIGWAAAYLTLQGISGFKLIKLNFMDYPLPHPVTDSKLYERLSAISLHPDFKLEQGAWGTRFVFKDMTTHKILIDQKKQTYSIISKLTKKNLVKKRHNPGVTEYSFAFTSVPIIRQLVDEATTSLSEPDPTSAKRAN
ncbi:hypothetical protein [Paenibacillus sp. Leaf72]|uniref:hypothetical protein n=1 Tax=Paenibacillus sp. Leaf72 TaxID=1736234 RepID=UPI0006FC7EFC|nr:hypothetical protein [Paenibacillus sp. Leaf72]KQN96198.1 hypothetical protein ASF12_25630 [Paenibacillus sp. Leaf72]